MKSPDLFSSLSLFLAGLLLCPGNNAVSAEQVNFYVHNKCPFPIWPATAPNTGQPVIADGGFYLPPGSIKCISAPPAWTGRIWSRTGCRFESNWRPACETGDCDGRLACSGLIGTPPATLVQVSLQADRAKPSFYDVSLVDGYNVPISVQTRPARPKCGVPGCSENLNGICPEELQVVNGEGEVVACKSACLTFDADKFCCRNKYGTPDKCKPTVYSRMFKDACPGYYSYAYDTPPPLVTCSSTEFVITFCPQTWGGEQAQVLNHTSS